MKKNKIYLIFTIFVLLFLIFLFSSDIKAFTFEYEGHEFNSEDFQELEFFEYNIAFKFNDKLNLFSSTAPSIYNVNSLNIKGDKIYRYQFVYSKAQKKFVLDFKQFIDTGSLSINWNLDNIKNTLSYLNYDLKDSEGNILINAVNKRPPDGFPLSFNIVPETSTDKVPIRIETEEYKSTNATVDTSFLFSYTFDNKKWHGLKHEVLAENSDGTFQMKQYIDVYKNGTYKIRHWNEKEGKNFYTEIEVSNIVYTKDNADDYINGVFVFVK